MGERAYDREYRCVFDSSDASAFSWTQIDNAFGAVEGPVPRLKPTDAEEDPVRSRELAFTGDPFAHRTAVR